MKGAQQSNPLIWVFQVLASHWRRKPLQFATMIIGLASATALFSGVQALNMQARASYDQAASLLGADQYPIIRRELSEPFSQELYVKLRRQGVPVSPVIQGEIVFETRRLTLIGIDIVTIPRASAPISLTSTPTQEADPTAFMRPPWQAYMAIDDLTRLNGADGSVLTLSNGVALPPAYGLMDSVPGTVFVDIGAAQTVLAMSGMISSMIYDAPLVTLEHQAVLSAEGFSISLPSRDTDISRLTDSFHLNLSAFGYLSFLVGLLIVHASTGLAFEQRRQMMRTLRACGISGRMLTIALIIEIVVIALIAGAIGVFLGYLIAAGLLPNVSLTLRGLYGAQVDNALSVRPIWLIVGMAMSVAGALLASISMVFKARSMPILATAQPQAWLGIQRNSFRRQAMIGAVLFGLLLIALFSPRSLSAGFFMMGALLLSASLILPLLLSLILALAKKLFSGSPVTEWFWADSRQQLSGLSLALQALLLALAVNIGVGAMVSSFRDTFDGWLDQRLAAEIYVNPGRADRAAQIAEWLTTQPSVARILPMAFASSRYGELPISIFGYTDDPTYTDNWPLLSSLPDAWAIVGAQEGVLINEQMARTHQLKVGDRIDLTSPAGKWQASIVGIYSDYGNTTGQVMLTVRGLNIHWPDTPSSLFAVRADKARSADLVTSLQSQFDLGQTELIDQQALKVFSKGVFEQTFAVTAALNVLTFIVAGIALFASLASLSAARLPQLAPLWAMGLQRADLSRLELVKSVVLALLTAIMAVPLGLGVAWILTNVINVTAFGWRLPLFVYPGQFAALGLIAMATAFFAALFPALQLQRMAPARLVKIFAEER